MDTSKYTVKGTSYDNLYASFVNLLPEWKQSVKEWSKDHFDKNRRTILVTMKNGIMIRFGCYREDDNQWTWQAFVVPSIKTQEKLGIRKLENENYDLDAASIG